MIEIRWRPARINPIIRRFIIADLILFAGWGLVDPIFAIFILDKIEGATLITLGVVAAVYWFVKSLIQIPVAIALDKTPTEKDDYMVLVAALVLAGIASFAFTTINQIWQLYLVQLVKAVAFALYLPSFYSIFSGHLDKDHRSLEFSLDSTSVGIAAGTAGLISGVLAKYFGFTMVFIVVAILCFLAAGVIFSSPELVFPHRRRPLHLGVGNHTPKNINK